MMICELITDKKEIEKRFPQLGSRIRYEQYSFAFACNEELVAVGEIAFEDDQSVEIKMLETLVKRKGYGRMFVAHLRSLPNVVELWGESVPDAVPFWHKVGASFEPSVYEDYLETDEHEEGFLIPFTIKQ